MMVIYKTNAESKTCKKMLSSDMYNEHMSHL